MDNTGQDQNKLEVMDQNQPPMQGYDNQMKKQSDDHPRYLDNDYRSRDVTKHRRGGQGPRRGGRKNKLTKSNVLPDNQKRFNPLL